jgi:hypothetical protein
MLWVVRLNVTTKVESHIATLTHVISPFFSSGLILSNERSRFSPIQPCKTRDPKGQVVAKLGTLMAPKKATEPNAPRIPGRAEVSKI